MEEALVRNALGLVDKVEGVGLGTEVDFLGPGGRETSLQAKDQNE